MAIAHLQIEVTQITNLQKNGSLKMLLSLFGIFILQTSI